MRRTVLISALVIGLASSAAAQGPVTATWNTNPETDIAGYRIVVDSTIYDVGNVTTFTTPTLPAGPHTAVVMAYNHNNEVSPTSTPPVPFTVPGQATDPCTDPVSGHMPAVFPTSVTVTTGKPGSPSSLNYKLASPDPIVEVAVVVDGQDAVVRRVNDPSEDLTPFTGLWFTQPGTGTHTVAIRIKTSFGCAVTKATFSPLVVK